MVEEGCLEMTCCTDDGEGEVEVSAKQWSQGGCRCLYRNRLPLITVPLQRP